MKILHTADVHLRQVEDDRWQALTTIIDQAKDLQVDALTIGGDLFDQDLNANQIRQELRVLLADLPFKVIIIPGNHDLKSFDQGFYFGENVELIDQLGQKIELDGTDIWGIPVDTLTGSQLLGAISELNQKLNPEKTNVLLFHGELTDIFFKPEEFGDEGQERYLPLKLNYLDQTKFDYVLAGHFHKNFIVKRLTNKRLKQGGFFVYPGSPVSITTKENGPRSAALIGPNKAPVAVTLNTHHYQPVKLELDPGQDQKSLQNFEKQLKKLDQLSTGLIELKGYFNQTKLDLTEKQLIVKIEQLATKYHSQLNEKQTKVKDINLVLDSGIYQAFQQQLTQTQLKAKEKQSLEKLLIEAMMRVNS